MVKIFDLNLNPTEFPEAMATATRLGRLCALCGAKKLSSVRLVSDLVAPKCAYGYAQGLKQAYNAGYWAGELIVKGVG